MLGFVRRNLLTGVLAITPLVLTLWVLWRIYCLIADMLRPLLSKLPYVNDHYPEFALTLLGILAFIPLLVLVGLFTRNLAGEAVFRLLDRVIDRIPVVKGLFTTFKQITAVFEKDQGRSFQRVVLVPFPRPGLYALAFVTRDEPGTELVAVFLPTSPNPTTGFLLLVARHEMRAIALTVEDAFRIVISGGSIMTASQLAEMCPPVGSREGNDSGGGS